MEPAWLWHALLGPEGGLEDCDPLPGFLRMPTSLGSPASSPLDDRRGSPAVLEILACLLLLGGVCLWAWS